MSMQLLPPVPPPELLPSEASLPVLEPPPVGVLHPVPESDPVPLGSSFSAETNDGPDCGAVAVPAAAGPATAIIVAVPAPTIASAARPIKVRCRC